MRASHVISPQACAQVHVACAGQPSIMADMRFIHLFLVGYFVLALGVGLALWQTGVLGRVAPIWVGIGVLVAVGMGIMLSVASGKPTVTEEIER